MSTKENTSLVVKASDARVVFVTHPTLKDAKRLARELVQHQLVACVTIVPQVSSFYTWQDEVCEDSEVLLVCKTHVENLEALCGYICDKHPYDVPECVALPITEGSQAYMTWLGDVCPPINM